MTALEQLKKLSESLPPVWHGQPALKAAIVEAEQMRTALAEMTVEFVAAHKAGNISTMPQTAQRIIRNAEKCFGNQQSTKEK